MLTYEQWKAAGRPYKLSYQSGESKPFTSESISTYIKHLLKPTHANAFLVGVPNLISAEQRLNIMRRVLFWIWCNKTINSWLY